MAPRPLGPVAIAALGFLIEADMHPYEMYQLASQRGEDRIIAVSPGTLYRAVYTLQGRGLVRATGTEREGARPERTTFSITEAGTALLRERVAEMLRTPAVEHPEMLLALAEAHNLPAESVIALLTERRAKLAESIADNDATTASAAKRHVPEMYTAHAGFRRRLLEAEFEWIGEFVGRLESGELDWHDTRTAAQKACSPSARAASAPTRS